MRITLDVPDTLRLLAVIAAICAVTHLYLN